MADTMSVKAILSAEDRNFSSTLKGASGAVGTLGTKLKGGLGFGVLTGIGQQAFHTLTSGCSELIGELNSSSAAWQTFEANMGILGKSGKEVDSVKKELQEFAQETIYSSSDMAQTYAQLSAVGTKNTAKLVKGFGGLAAAAENPKQAMKTLSQQATQMAGRPTVAWQDFKLMMEQSPAGIAAVAKEMGMTTSEMVSQIQDGKIKTEDFFAAVEKVGNSEGFSKMARSYKTASQAMDGLKETLGNKLMPAFQLLSQKSIGGLEGIISAIEKIDAEALAEKVAAGIEKAKPYWESFKKVLSAVGKVVKKVGKFLLDHSDTIAKAIPYVAGLAVAFKGFKIVKSIVPGVSGFASSITKLAGKGIGGIASKLFGISAGEKAAGSTAVTTAPQMLAAAKSFMMMGAAVLMISAGFALLAFSAIKLAAAGPLAIGVMAGLVIALAALGFGMGLLLKMLAPMGAQLVPVATAMLLMGAAVLIVAAGFALLAFTAISLANAGGPAIAVMVGMVAAIALLAIGAAILGPALTAGAIGLIAFGVAMLLVGAGVLLASAGMALLATQLPVIAAYGAAAAVAIAQLGLGMIVFAAGALLAGVASVVLGAGLVVVAVGMAAVAIATLAAAVGVAALGVAVMVLGVSLVITAAAVTMIAALLPIVGVGALLCVASFAALLAVTVALAATLLLLSIPLLLIGPAAIVAGLGIAAFGLAMAAAAIGTIAMAAALKAVKSSMKSIANSAKSAEKSLKSMRMAVKVVESGLDAIGSKAKSAMDKLKSAFDNTANKVKSSGQKVGTGFSQGLRTGLNKAILIAMQASTTVSASLKIGYAPAYSAGAYIGKGFANGMMSQLARIKSAAAQMAAAADKAVRAKAKISSPSKVSDKLGGWWGEGFANGIESMKNKVASVAQNLVSIPNLSAPGLAYSGELSADYSYSRNASYSIEVPLAVDGREFARATVTYTQDELDRNQMRENRKKGKR